MHSEVKGNIQWMIWDAWSSSQLDDFGCLSSKRLIKSRPFYLCWKTYAFFSENSLMNFDPLLINFWFEKSLAYSVHIK